MLHWLFKLISVSRFYLYSQVSWCMFSTIYRRVIKHFSLELNDFFTHYFMVTKQICEKNYVNKNIIWSLPMFLTPTCIVGKSFLPVYLNYSNSSLKCRHLQQLCNIIWQLALFWKSGKDCKSHKHLSLNSVFLSWLENVYFFFI